MNFIFSGAFTRRTAVFLCWVNLLVFAPGLTFAYNAEFLDWEKKVASQNPRILAQKAMASSSSAGVFSRFTLPKLKTETVLGQGSFETGLTQEIPFPGKMFVAFLTNQNGALNARETLRMAAGEVLGGFADSYLSLFLLDRRERFTKAHRESLRQHESQLAGKVFAGQEKRSAFLDTQMEGLVMENDALRLSGEKEGAWAKFDSFLENPPARREVEKSFSAVQFRIYLFAASTNETVFRSALRKSALWRAQEYLVKQREGILSGSWVSLFPDLSLSAKYKSSTGALDPSANPVQVQVNLEIPWAVLPTAGEISEMASMLRAAKEELRATEKFLASEVRAEIAAYESGLKRHELYKARLKPLLRQSLAEVQSQAGEAEYFETLHKVIRANEDFLQNRIDMERHLRRIEALLSVSLEKLSLENESFVKAVGSESLGDEHVH